MADFKPTDDQQRAIDARGSVTVTAAAGSGKTAVLTKRVLDLIVGKNPIDADKLLVVTFTNAAAEEMRNRITSGMNELVAASPENTDLLRQQALLSKAKITTIDSFCIGLVKENFFKLNISPDFKPAEKSRLEAVKMEAMHETLEEYYGVDDADFNNMLSAFGDVDSDSKTVEALFTVYEYMCSLPFPMVWLNESVEAYNTVEPQNSKWVEFLIKDTYDYTQYIIKSLNFVLSNDTLPSQNFERVTLAKNCVLNILNALEKGEYQKIHLAVKAFEHNYNVSNAKNIDEDAKRVYNLCSQKLKKYEKTVKLRFEASYEEICEDVKKLYPIMKKFAEVLRSFDVCYMRKKTEQGVFSFADIERMALNLLVSYEDDNLVPTEYGRLLSENIAEVMVDEYQDTNDLQDAIFRVLSSDGKRLFTVGDAKQSIYRFRQANPANFINRIEDCSKNEHSEVIPLSKNFRSRAGVCSFTNYIFSTLMSKELGDIDYNENNHLIPGATYPESDEPCVTVDFINNCGHSDTKAIAYRLAEVIKNMMTYPCVTDKETKELRNARYSDFVILASKRKEFPEICEVLEQAGIPTWTDSDTPLCDAKEVGWALSILKIICNPTKDVAFLSAMLSPAFNFTAEETAVMRNKYSRRLSVYEMVKKSADEGNVKSARMLNILNELRREINCMPYGLFMQRMYEKTGLLSFVCALKKGNERRANLIRLSELASEFETFNTDGDLDSFAAYIEKAGKDISCPKTVSDADDVVRLMTVHRSKGLEFPIVFLTGLTSSFNTTEFNARLLFDRKLGIGLKITDREKHYSYSPFSREAIIAASERAARSESVRLLYVAFTRASEKLYLMFPSDDPGEMLKSAFDEKGVLWYEQKKGYTRAFQIYTNFVDMLLTIIMANELDAINTIFDAYTEYTEKNAELYSIGTQGGPFLTKFIHSLASEPDATIETASKDMSNDAAIESMKQKLNFKYAYSQLNGIASKYAVTSMIEKVTDREYFYSSRPSFESAKGLTPGERGTAMHKFLEVADFETASKDVETEIKRLCENGFISDAQAASLDRKKLSAFFESDIYKRISNADNVYREFRFMTEETANTVDASLDDMFNDEKVVIQGIADCIIEENGCLTVIDYKTDRVEDMNTLCERYAEQLRIYSGCIEKCLKKPVSDCVIYSLFKNESINLRKL